MNAALITKQGPTAAIRRFSRSSAGTRRVRSCVAKKNRNAKCV